MQIAILFITLGLLIPFNTITAKGEIEFRYDKDKITKRKSLVDAYKRFGKSYAPYQSSNSSLEPKIAKKLEIIFTLTDMAVIEKVLLLEFIGKIDQEEIGRETSYRDYYREILAELKSLNLLDKRLLKVREDLITGINHHRDVLEAWLEAVRRDRTYKVKNGSGRWVHPGTKEGDQIFYELYYKYIRKQFKEENEENLQALSRHLCVLVF